MWASELGPIELILCSFMIVFDLPVDANGVNRPHNFSWTWLLDADTDRLPLQQSKLIVELLLKRFPSAANALAYAEDEKGRPALSIPHKDVRRVMNSHLLFFGRYALQAGPPEHQSQTCILRRAVDHYEGKTLDVVLKFMKFRDQFEREINARRMLNGGDKIDSEESAGFVMGLLRFYDSKDFAAAAGKRGYLDYPFCVVLAAADRFGLVCVHF